MIKIVVLLFLVLINEGLNAKSKFLTNVGLDSVFLTCRVLNIEKVKSNFIFKSKIIHEDNYGGIIKKQFFKKPHSFIKTTRTKSNFQIYVIYVQDTVTKIHYTIVSLGGKKSKGERVKRNNIYGIYLKKYFQYNFVISLGYYFEVNFKGVSIWVPMGYYTNNIYFSSNLEGIYYFKPSFTIALPERAATELPK